MITQEQMTTFKTVSKELVSYILENEEEFKANLITPIHKYNQTTYNISHAQIEGCIVECLITFKEDFNILAVFIDIDEVYSWYVSSHNKTQNDKVIELFDELHDKIFKCIMGDGYWDEVYMWLSCDKVRSVFDKVYNGVDWCDPDSDYDDIVRAYYSNLKPLVAELREQSTKGQ